MAASRVFVVGVGMTKVCYFSMRIILLSYLAWLASLKSRVSGKILITQTWFENQVDVYKHDYNAQCERVYIISV